MSNQNFDDPEAIPGIVSKTAVISPLEITDKDLTKINKYTLVPVKAEDVFIFKAMVADNEQDDRNYMPFDRKALQDLMKLYPGRTMLKDHDRSADNQIGRVYDTDLIEDPSRENAKGEVHTELHAKMYMIRTESNKDLVREIAGGIKKEVSTSTKPNKMICSICNTDNMVKYCRHWPGIKYTVDDGSPTGVKRTCIMLLSGAKEAYELSFVAVPAQPRAGTCKSVGFVKPIAEDSAETDKTDKIAKMDLRIFTQRVKNAESFFNN